jgi:hypothetical protein
MPLGNQAAGRYKLELLKELELFPYFIELLIPAKAKTSGNKKIKDF